MEPDDGVDDRAETRVDPRRAGPATADGTPAAQRRAELDAIDNGALREAVNWFVLAAGTSNVIMQLARRPVAYGVMESRVTEGNLFTNPKRRARTTVAYLAVVMLGGAEERAAMRRATNRSHARVTSEPGSSVAYRAFDPDLQTWVAACLFKGAEDAYLRAHGPMSVPFRDEFYRQSMAFGTTLQMPPEAWPQTRDDFEAYWRDEVAALEIDDATRDYLTRIVRLEYLGRRIPERVIRFRARLVAGYLPAEFRSLMHLPWTPDDQRRFDRFDRRLGRLMRVLPRGARERPLARQLRDVRRRLAEGRPLF